MTRSNHSNHSNDAQHIGQPSRQRNEAVDKEETDNCNKQHDHTGRQVVRILCMLCEAAGIRFGKTLHLQQSLA